MTEIETPALGPASAGAGIDRRVEQSLYARPPSKSQYPVHLRRQRQVERICRIPRLVAELLDEIDRHHGLGADLDRRLERFAGLDPDLLRALGGDRFPPSPMRAIGDGR
jgi:hypothetical protein